jgi:retron-type reverse transcriptase
MEHILASKIMKHGEQNNILYPLQHGFRKGHSCETQLIEFVEDISKNLQEGQQTDILILDFAKAFDKVNHSLLIHKLQHHGIIGNSVRWIQNWLANRKQSVVIDGSTSDAVSVDSGVPQGSS